MLIEERYATEECGLPEMLQSLLGTLEACNAVLATHT